MLSCNIGNYLIKGQSGRYIIITNKQKSSQLKYIKLLVLLFTFLIFKDSISEQELQTKVKRLLLKKLKVLCSLAFSNKHYSSLNSLKLLPQKINKLFSQKIINLSTLIYCSSDSSSEEKSLKLSLIS